ncbi:histone deacetylase domain-containing protein, partial [Cladorrhinum sp. PSN259]
MHADTMATNSAPLPAPQGQQQPTSTPARHTGDSEVVDRDLSHSLNHLTISTSTTTPAARTPRSPRPPAIALTPLKSVPDHHSPNSPTPRRPSSSMRSPLNGSTSSFARTPSRCGTPTLLKKASLNSLHSANGVPPLRRASSASILSPTHSRSAKSPLREMSPESSPPTANSVASGYFKAELERLQRPPEGAQQPSSIVILQDDCYGHRYSRPGTSKLNLSFVVERPERLQATTLGVAAAYVRLGGRHEGGAFPIEQSSAGTSPAPFVIKKSDRRVPLTSDAVTNVHGTKWMKELSLMCETAETKLASTETEVQRPDIDRGSDAPPPPKFSHHDLYLCQESQAAMEGAIGGVCDAVDAVFGPEAPKRAFVAIRPPGHHCSDDYPSGFCWVNNVHVGINHAALSHGLTHAAIIDFDLHHGDGSQEIAMRHNAAKLALSRDEKAKYRAAPSWQKTSIGYFSLHDINSFPCEYGDAEKVRNASVCIDNAHGQSIWNIHLESWEKEDEFWNLYETRYSVLLEKARKHLRQYTAFLHSKGLKSKGAIFISAGFDASEHEGEGMRRHKVHVPTEFYARITRDIVKIAEEEGTGVEGRVISVMEGGYSDRTLCSGALSHLCGLTSTAETDALTPYDPSWWSVDELAALELATKTPPAEMKQPRNITPPTYCSPTHASTARAIVPPRVQVRRSVSGLPVTTSNGYAQYRPPTPPPPEVPWTIAAAELSKLLIPEGRTVTSYTWQDLKVTRNRQRASEQDRPGSAASVAPSEAGDRPATRMNLRERKPRTSTVPETQERKPKQSRRLSAASAIVTEAQEQTSLPPLPQSTPAKSPARPDTAQSVQTVNNTIVVKKTRAKKTEPISKAAKASDVDIGTPKLDAAGPTNPRKSYSPDGMEKLTNRVQKIRITLVNKSQREAREQAMAEGVENTAVLSPTGSENAKPSNSSPVDSTEDTTMIGDFSSPTLPGDFAAPATPSSSSPLLSPTDTGFSTSVPSTPHTGKHHLATPIPKVNDRMFLNLSPPKGAVSEALKRFESQNQQQTLQWATPNTGIPGTPMAGPTPMRREDLPVFGSTGVIPFSP